MAHGSGDHSRLRVLLTGDFLGEPDEGMRKISQTLAQHIAQRHTVLTVNTRETPSLATLLRARRFAPHVLHYLTGPTLRSLVMLASYRRCMPQGVVTIASAVRPYFSRVGRGLLPVLRPDAVLTQSHRWEDVFAEAGSRVKFVPNGVDLVRFQPPQRGIRGRLRQKYGLPADDFLVLHVGHLKANRGLATVRGIQLAGIQTVVVGGTAMPRSEEVFRDLTSAGCIVIHRYLDSIEELYACADCYLFPLKDRPLSEFPSRYEEIGVIDTPLSVLEAMGCNLPVISTPFGGLPRMFSNVPGLHFFDGSLDAAIALVGQVRVEVSRGAARTRAAVSRFAWEQVADEISSAYQMVRNAAQVSVVGNTCRGAGPAARRMEDR